MNTVSINSNIYRGAEQYANMHNISVADAVEKAISLFLQKAEPKQKYQKPQSLRKRWLM